MARGGCIVVIARSGATKQSRCLRLPLDCFAEFIIGPATSGRTRWLAMTKWKTRAARKRYAAAAGIGVRVSLPARPAITMVTLSKPASSRLSRACVVV
jgi:hypothetical protein